MKRISIDFDGVLANRPSIPRKGDYMLAKPNKNALEAIWWLQDNNFNPYIQTARGKNERTGIELWLFWHGFPLLEVTNRKKSGTIAYIDDRAIRYTNWLDIIKYFG
jgi:hypothetical protein